MKIVVNRESMKKCLNTVSRALPDKSILPINDNFLLVIKGDTCYAYARNGKLQIKGQFAVVKSQGDVSMCVPGKTLLNTIGLMRDEEINLNYNPEKFVLNISAGKKRYKLTGYDPQHYVPKAITEGGNKFSVLSSKIIPYISKISKIVKWDDLREQIAGVSIASIEKDIVVSGAFELFYFCRAMLGVEPEAEFGFVIPKDISIALGQMEGAGDTHITIFEKSVFFSVDGFELNSTILDVKKLINLEQLFVHERDEYIIAPREELAMSLKRLINYSTDNSILRLELKDDELNLSCENEDFGKNAEEGIDIKNYGNKDCVVGISIKYLSSILNSIDSDTVKMFLTKPKISVFIQKGDTMDDSEVWGCAPMLLKEHANN